MYRLLDEEADYLLIYLIKIEFYEKEKFKITIV